MTLRTLNYGNYGIFLSMGNAGFISSIVGGPEAVFQYLGEEVFPKILEEFEKGHEKLLCWTGPRWNELLGESLFALLQMQLPASFLARVSNFEANEREPTAARRALLLREMKDTPPTV